MAGKLKSFHLLYSDLGPDIYLKSTKWTSLTKDVKIEKNILALSRLRCPKTPDLT